ncbi:hypothetical protein ACYATL_01810 [Actinotignum timonense]|uniref:hypothetical protein n=1 Tax=Actinotignum sp. GS-2025e TaxID=3427278 RepID=UPI003F4CA6FC
MLTAQVALLVPTVQVSPAVANGGTVRHAQLSARTVISARTVSQAGGGGTI